MYTTVDTIKALLTECFIAAQHRGANSFNGELCDYRPTADDFDHICINLAFCPTRAQWLEAGIADVSDQYVGTFEGQIESLVDEHRRCNHDDSDVAECPLCQLEQEHRHYNHDQLIVGCPLCEAAADARPQVIAALGQLADAWGRLNDLWHTHSDAAPINDLLDNGYPGNWDSFDEMYEELLQWFGTVRK